MTYTSAEIAEAYGERLEETFAAFLGLGKALGLNTSGWRMESGADGTGPYELRSSQFQWREPYGIPGWLGMDAESAYGRLRHYCIALGAVISAQEERQVDSD